MDSKLIFVDLTQIFDVQRFLRTFFVESMQILPTSGNGGFTIRRFFEEQKTP